MKSSALKKSDGARTPAHTPGPWQTYHGGADAYMIATQRNGSRTVVSEISGDSDIALANARLIACAPEMLAMLYELNDMIEGGSPEIEALIKKAGGSFE